MAVNYSAVLILVGDPGTALISTANIYTLSTLYGENSFTLGAAVARTIAGTFGTAVTKKAGDVSINSSDKFKHYMDLATKLDREASLRALGSTSAFAGGISISDKETYEADTDRVQPSFTRDLHNDPGNVRDNDDGWAS